MAATVAGAALALGLGAAWALRPRPPELDGAVVFSTLLSVLRGQVEPARAHDALGKSGDPRRWIGPGATMDQLAAGSLSGWLADGATWVLLGPSSGSHGAVLDTLETAVAEAPVERWPFPPEDETAAGVQGERWSSLVERPDRRLVVVAVGEAAPALLDFLAEAPLVRDRLAAVTLLAGPFGREAVRERLPERLRHEVLDLEAARGVPWVDRPESEADRLPPPYDDARAPSRWVVRRSLEAGPVKELAEPATARALVATLALLAAAARG